MAENKAKTTNEKGADNVQIPLEGMVIQPCPFCGAEENGKYPPEVVNISPPNMANEYAVLCGNCNIMGACATPNLKVGEAYSIDSAYDKAKKEAIDIWNYRTSDVYELYNELLNTVKSKYENESRHETALKYIKNCEAENIKSQRAV